MVSCRPNLRRYPVDFTLHHYRKFGFDLAASSGIAPPLALGSLLFRLQRSRPTYHFAGLVIEDLPYLSMIPIVGGMWLRPPVQFFQPLSHLISTHFTNIARFAAWAVDSQEGQQVAFQIHDPPRRIQVIRLRECCGSTGGNCSSKRREALCHTMRVSFQ
jgi:hypothetical protein